MVRRFTCVWVALIPLCGLPVDSLAEIYRCSTGGGAVEFTDRPCPGGEVTTPSAGTGLVLPALSDQERQQADALSERAAKDEADAQREAARHAQRRAKQQRENDVACTQATAALERLRTTRRKGYRLADDARLVAEEHKYAAMRSRHCGRRARPVTCAATRRRRFTSRRIDLP